MAGKLGVNLERACKNLDGVFSVAALAVNFPPYLKCAGRARVQFEDLPHAAGGEFQIRAAELISKLRILRGQLA